MKVTTAHKLKNRCIFHTVGPKYYSDPNPKETLAKCYQNCLEMADGLQFESIAFPSISTGAYGYPMEEAAEICAKIICNFKPEYLKHAYMCVITDEAEAIYNEAIDNEVQKVVA